MDWLKLIVKSVTDYIRDPYLPDSRAFWIGISTAVPLTGIGLSVGLWGWLNDGESASTTIRNVGLILAALTALPVAIWRGIVADKQSAATRNQANSAQQSLRNERYQKGAEMLGSKHLSVRLAGIYALQRLAKEYPGEYQLQIMRILSTFARYPVPDGAHVEEVEAKIGRPHIREDVQAVIGVINKRIEESIKLEPMEMSYLDLSYTDLMYGDLREAKLAGASLRKANLYHATLTRANMKGAEFAFVNLQKAALQCTDLSRAKLIKTKMSEAILSNTILSGAYLSGVIGLTQAQLDEARADLGDPPILDGVLDAETGQPLVWSGGRGAPLKDDD